MFNFGTPYCIQVSPPDPCSRSRNGCQGSQGIVHLVVNSYTDRLSGLAKLPLLMKVYMKTFYGHFRIGECPMLVVRLG